MKALADRLTAWLTAKARARDARVLQQYWQANHGPAQQSAHSAGVGAWGGGQAGGGGCDAGGGSGSC